MSEQSKYVIHTIAAAPRNGLNINDGSPHTLINDAHTSQNLLGALPIMHPDEPSWVCVLPLQQPQNEGEGGSYAGMNAPVIDKWCTIDELSPKLLAPNMRFVLQHLEEQGAAVGFNYSLDPRTRVVAGAERVKFKPNSWDHFHMHWMTGVHAVAEEVTVSDTVTIQAGSWSMDIRPHRYLSEMFSHAIEAVLDQEYRKPEPLLGGLDARVLSREARSTLPYSPEGGIMFALPTKSYANPVMLSQALKSAHDGFSTIHQKVWDLFVTNYAAVEASGWIEPYIVRPEEDIAQRLMTFTDTESIRNGIARFFSALRPESQVTNPMNWLYKSPSHSIAVYKHETDYLVSVLPHLMHPTNWLAALGIFEARKSQGADLSNHRLRALAYANRLGATALPVLAPSPDERTGI